MQELKRGKDGKKKMLLLVYLQQSKINESYFSVSSSLIATKEDTKALRWVPWEEAKRYYDFQEAKSRVVSGTMPARKSPSDCRFFQFLLVEEGKVLTVKQQKHLETSRRSKLSALEYNELTKSILSERTTDTMGDLMNVESSRSAKGPPGIDFQELVDDASAADTDEEDGSEGGGVHPTLAALFKEDMGAPSADARSQVAIPMPILHLHRAHHCTNPKKIGT